VDYVKVLLLYLPAGTEQNEDKPVTTVGDEPRIEPENSRTKSNTADR
jgi:hypothetical protein